MLPKSYTCKVILFSMSWVLISFEDLQDFILTRLDLVKTRWTRWTRVKIGGIFGKVHWIKMDVITTVFTSDEVKSKIIW
jgi:hypothetical protein